MKNYSFNYVLPQEHYDIISSSELSNTDKERCYIFLQLIYFTEDHYEEFRELSQSYIQNNLGIRANTLIDWLITNKLIYVDFMYTPSVKSRGYKMRFTNYPVLIKIPVTNKRYIKLKMDRIKSRRDAFSNVRNQMKTMKGYYLEFVTDLDLDLCQTIVDAGLLVNPNKFIHSQFALTNLVDKSYYFRRNKTNNRLDSNITNFSKELRNSVKSTDWFNIDFSNSQPFLISLLLKCKKSSERNPIFDIINDTLYAYRVNSCVKLLNAIPVEEVDDFFNVCQSGKFYDNLVSSLVDNFEEERNKVKKSMFLILYSKGKISDKNFKAKYPNITKWINEFKVKNDYREFPIMLQRIESAIVLDNICPILIQKNIHHTTVHDSFIVKEKDIESVKTVIEDLFGIYAPNIKTENLK